MGLPAAICRKLMCKWKDPSPRSGRSEGNTNPAAATGDDALIRAATPTTRLYTFLINHLKFLTVRGGLNQVLPRLKGRGAGPALLAALVGVMGVLVPLRGIAWSCQALLWALLCPAVAGSGVIHLPSPTTAGAFHGAGAADSPAEHRGEGEPAETSKLQRFPFSKCQQIWRGKKQIS